VWVGTSPSNRGGAQAGIEPAVSAGVDVTLPRRRPPSPSQVAALPSNSAAGAVARDLEAMAERTGATRRETRRWARGCSKHAFAPAAQFRPRIKAAVCHPPSPRAQSRHQRDQLASETSVAGDDPVNNSDPSGLFCADALNPFSSGFGQCWSSGYSNAYHHPAQAAAVAGAVVAVTLVTFATAGGDLPVLASVGGGTVIEAGVGGAGDTILITSGTPITAATIAAWTSVGASATQATIDCTNKLDATCAYDWATTLIGAGTLDPGLPGSDFLKSLIGLGASYPSPFSASNVCKP
jgi:hypothetical protein